LEVLAGYRILESLAKVAPLNQSIDGWREHVAVLPLIQIHGTRVLLTSKRELGFLLAPDLLAPRRQHRGHHHRQQGNAHQHRRHRVSPLAVLTL
jgi:hypothetical protein